MRDPHHVPRGFAERRVGASHLRPLAHDLPHRELMRAAHTRAIRVARRAPPLTAAPVRDRRARPSTGSARRPRRPGDIAPRSAAERRQSRITRAHCRSPPSAPDRSAPARRAERDTEGRRHVGAVVQQECAIAHCDEIFRAVPRSSGGGACPRRSRAPAATRRSRRMRAAPSTVSASRRHDRALRVEEVRQIHRALPLGHGAAARGAVAPHRPVARPPGCRPPSRAWTFSAAVPVAPEMIAPACPMRRPGGAVRPAMKPTTGLRHVLRHVACSVLLIGPADLTDHDDAQRWPGRARTLSRQSMKFVPLIGSPPMPTQVVWPKPDARELIDDLVGQRPRATHESDRSRRADPPRDDADLAHARRDEPRAVRPDQPRAVLAARTGRPASCRAPARPR